MGGFETVAMAALGAVQSHQRYRAQNTAINARQQVEASRQAQARQIRERDMRGRLASLQATQRARFGAAGIGGGGSANAVMNGLAKATEQSIQDGRAGDRLRLQGSTASAQKSRRLNLIDYRQSQIRRLPGPGTGLSLLER